MALHASTLRPAAAVEDWPPYSRPPGLSISGRLDRGHPPVHPAFRAGPPRVPYQGFTVGPLNIFFSRGEMAITLVLELTCALEISEQMNRLHNVSAQGGADRTAQGPSHWSALLYLCLSPNELLHRIWPFLRETFRLHSRVPIHHGLFHPRHVFLPDRTDMLDP